MSTTYTIAGASALALLLACYWAQKYLPPPKPKIVGIDLGTTFSCIAVLYAGSGRVEVIPDAKGRKTTPSIVAVRSKHNYLVGYDALEYGNYRPSDVFYDAKRFIGLDFDNASLAKEASRYPFKIWLNGTKAVFETSDDLTSLQPEEISSIVLKHLRDMAESHLKIGRVQGAVISVPAEFDEKRRNATIEAARKAGLDVYRLISEPTAAALAYGLHQKQNVSNVIIYDFGGGTLDVSVLMILGGIFLTRAMAVSALISDTMVHKTAEADDSQATELNFYRRGIATFSEIPQVFSHSNLTQLSLAGNKITVVPPSIADLSTLQVLNLYGNRIEELPTSMSSLPRLITLNLGGNRLRTLPRGFGSFAALEVLDLTRNQLNERSLPGNFFMMETLRALYLCENEFEAIPSDVRNLKNLQILAVRDNNIIYLPKELGELSRLRELHVQGNRLAVLPPEVAALDLAGPKSTLRMDANPWVTPIESHWRQGAVQLMNYLRSETYKYLYGRHLAAGGSPPAKVNA